MSSTVKKKQQGVQCAGFGTWGRGGVTVCCWSILYLRQLNFACHVCQWLSSAFTCFGTQMLKIDVVIFVRKD